MTNLCKSCRWPVRLHGGLGACFLATVPADASADEMWAWLQHEHGVDAHTSPSVVRVSATTRHYQNRTTFAEATTLTAALRAVCAEVLR